MDRYLDKPKQPSALSGAGNTGEERDLLRRAFPGFVVSHAHRESISKRQFAYRMVDCINKLLLFGVFSQSSGAGNTGVSLLQIVALLVICSQVRVKKHGEGQSSSGATGESGAGSLGGSRGGGGDENGRIGRGIGAGRRNGMGGGAQRRGNEDDDDNEHVVGNVENGMNRRPEDIANTFLPIILQSIAIITTIDGAQLSTTGTVIRSLSMIINLAAFICCTAVLGPLHTNPRVARILNPRIAGILSSIGSALAILGFISVMAIYLPLM